MSLNNTPLQGAYINVVSGNFIIAQPLGSTMVLIIVTADVYDESMIAPSIIN